MIVSWKQIKFFDYILVSIMSLAGSMNQMLFFPFEQQEHDTLWTLWNLFICPESILSSIAV